MSVPSDGLPTSREYTKKMQEALNKMDKNWIDCDEYCNLMIEEVKNFPTRSAWESGLDAYKLYEYLRISEVPLYISIVQEKKKGKLAALACQLRKSIAAFKEKICQN